MSKILHSLYPYIHVYSYIHQAGAVAVRTCNSSLFIVTVKLAEDMFYQIVKLLTDSGEIEFANLFVDGTKIEANANRYSFVWAKSTSKYEARVDEKLAKLLDRLSVEYALFIENNEPKAYLEALKEKARRITFVYGRGKRKAQLQRDMEKLEKLFVRRLKEREQTAYIKPQNYERSKTRKYRNNAYMRDNLPYDPETDTYICPAGNNTPM